MITIPTTPEAARQVVVLRRLGTGWSALRATLDDSGVTIAETMSFDGTAAPVPQASTGDASTTTVPQTKLEAWLEQHDNPDVYVLLPAGHTISRVLELNQEDDEDLDQTLRLQAESHLLGGAPAHRVGMTTLPARPHASRQGIVITWPESATIELPPMAEQPLCIPETAALLALIPTTQLEGPLLHVDQATGSFAIVLENDNGLIVRSTREQSADSASWREAIIHAVVETAVTANEPLDQVEQLRNEVRAAIEGRDELLLLPTSIRSVLQNSIKGSKDEDWWQEWGLSVGALLATMGSVQALANLRANKEVQTLGVPGEIMRALSLPIPMVAILVAALFAITVIPMVASWVRLSITESKIEDQSRLESVLTTSEQQKGIYNEIARRSWPMTKLLGDLANCIPLGIRADTIIVQEGDSIILRGSAGEYKGASPTDLIKEMLVQLEKTDVFVDFNSSEEPIGSGGRQPFSLTLRVKSPFKQVRSFTNDFAKTSHAKLRYPHAFNDSDSEGSGPTTDTALAMTTGRNEGTQTQGSAPTNANRELASSRPATTSTRSDLSGSSSSGDAPPGVGRASLLGPRGGTSSRSRGSSSSRTTGSIEGSTGGASRRSQSTGARGSSGPAPIPESPTDTELRAMSVSEAKDILTRVAEARQRDDLDETTKARLKSDFDRILEHMRVAQANSSGGTG